MFRMLVTVLVLASFVWLGRDVTNVRQEPTVQMIAVEGEGAAYWPRWRGPSGQGLASGSGYPDSWSATENVLWKTPVAGRGNSSPIVWGNRIFLTTAYDNGRRLAVLAFRRSDGSRLWESFVPEDRAHSVHQKKWSRLSDSDN